MKKETQVFLNKRAQKDLDKVPLFIVKKFQAWVIAVERYGILATRQIKGFHDEPLQGKRSGERSLRLNRSYRVIYVENEQSELVIIKVIEVNKHGY